MPGESRLRRRMSALLSKKYLPNLLAIVVALLVRGVFLLLSASWQQVSKLGYAGRGGQTLTQPVAHITRAGRRIVEVMEPSFLIAVKMQ